VAVEAVPGLTLTEATAALEVDGFHADFHVVSDPEPRVRCGSCGTTMSPRTIEVVRVLRIEGESDPADEAMVAGVRCVTCGCRGVLIATYGPAADAADAEVVAALADAPTRTAGGSPEPS
jgi:ribosomal protein S27E